mmetsp:Transcript_7633/g.28615  ORF Transcript_7633/g.28615 Transcript_7633/m.28615 type:complete len:413 (-) Transcript_7633:89-1327(-)
MNPLSWLSQSLGHLFANPSKNDSTPLHPSPESEFLGKKRKREPQKNESHRRKRRKSRSKLVHSLDDSSWAVILKRNVVCLATCNTCVLFSHKEEVAVRTMKDMDDEFQKEKDAMCEKLRNGLYFRMFRLFPSLKQQDVHRLKLSQEAVYSITPESIARIHARRCKRILRLAHRDPGKKCKVWDVFAGWGGNVAELLQQDCEVLASELDSKHLLAAHYNVHAVFGLGHNNITWIHLDSLRLLEMHKLWRNRDCSAQKSFGESTFQDTAQSWLPQEYIPAANTARQDQLEYLSLVEKTMCELDTVDAIILCPPWGGPEIYDKGDAIDLRSDLPIDCVDLFASAHGVSKNILMMMPRNSNTNQVSDMMDMIHGDAQHCEIQENYFNDRLLTLSFYFNDLAVRKKKKKMKNEVVHG